MLGFVSLSFKKEVILIHLLPEVKRCKQNAQLSSNRTWSVVAIVIKVFDTGFLRVAKTVCLVLYMRSSIYHVCIKVKVL